jgi:hypothetical protein
MERSQKTKTTQEVSLRDTQSDWKEIVWERNKVEHKFWEESWNKKSGD